VIDESFQAAREAERALLGALLVAGASGEETPIAEVQKIVKPADFLDHGFHDDSHSRIFQAMVDAGKSDQISVAHQLNAQDRLQKGDCTYLLELVSIAPGPECQHYAQVVHSYAEQRRGEGQEEAVEEFIPTVLELPPIAWQGLFADYLDLVSGTTEAADAFHYATFCQILGCTLGRRLHVYHATTLYPNFYICLVGRSGLTRKDTCWARANGILLRLHAKDEKYITPAGDEEENPPFRIVRGMRSYEGLLDELAGEKKVRLILLGELLSLLAKSKQESLSNIIPQLTELYDCPDLVNPPVHQKTVDCQEPFISIMAGTTLAWLQKALTEREIYGGFANRWLYFFGTPKDPKPNPPRMNPGKRDALIEAINTVRIWADDTPNGELTISGEAEALFAGYYEQYYQRCKPEGLIPTLIVRLQDYVWKLALLYAAMDLSDVIKPAHIQPAIAVASYLELSVAEVFRGFTMTAGKLAEMKVLEYLKNLRKPIDYRLIYKNLNISAKELDTYIEPLIKMGIIKNNYRRSRRGDVRMLEAV